MQHIIRLTQPQRALLLELATTPHPAIPVIGPNVTKAKTLIGHGFASGRREKCLVKGPHHDTEQVMVSITQAGRAWLDHPDQEQDAVGLLLKLVQIWPSTLTLVIDGSDGWRGISVIHSRDIAAADDLEFKRKFAVVKLPIKTVP
jgi:hypothetical protein